MAVAHTGSIPLVSDVRDLQQIGPYRVLRFIAEGAMSWVFEVEDPKFAGRRLALKLLKPSAAEGEELQRFENEARWLASIDHPNIVTIFDFGRDEPSGCFYYTMTFVEGQTLKDRLTAEPLEVGEAIPLFASLLNGLEALHEGHLVHRDVKPANVLLDTRGHARIADLGIARSQVDSGQTRTGIAIGTARYMSPEQARGMPVDARSDLFSLALTLYESLAGRGVYDEIDGVDASSGIDVLSYLGSRTRSKQELELSIPRELGPRLGAVLRKALRIDPEERFQTAGEMRDALAGVLSSNQFHYAPSSLLSLLGVALGSLLGALLAPLSWLWGKLSAPLRTGPAAVEAHGARPTPLPRPQPPAPPAPPPGSRSGGSEGGTVMFPVESPSELDAISPSGPAPRPAVAADATGIVAVSDEPGTDRIPVALAIVRCPDAALVGSRVPLDAFPFVIGRSEACDLTIARDDGLSRRHLELAEVDGSYQVRDLGTTNGSWVNGQRIVEGDWQPLVFEDSIALSKTALQVVADIPDFEDLRGTVLADRYELEDRLYSSAKASTYRAVDRKLPRKLAIKILAPAFARYPQTMEQFRREAEAAAGLEHASICRILDFGEACVSLRGGSSSVPYLCMKLLEGGHLGDRIASFDFPPEQAMSWLKVIAEALCSAHEQGVVHGGLKPNCVVFDDSGRPFLSDFAFAFTGDESAARPVVGSPHFLAPEQWNRESATPRTDQYSFAALAYLLLTGSRPHEGQAHPEVREKNFRRPPAPAHLEAETNGRRLPASVTPVLERALSVEAQDRFESVADLMGALEQAWEPSSQQRDPEVFLSYRRRASAMCANFLSRELSDKYGISSFLDTERRDRAVRFPKKIRDAIEQCDVFVCLLAEDTLESAMVREEVELACQLDKDIIPVFQESFQDEAYQERLLARSDELPASVTAMLEYDGVDLLDRRGIFFDVSVEKLAGLVRRTVDANSREG